MIAVIADDLSGAAELAGAAAKFGLRAEVHTVFNARADAELVAVDTDTRSLPAPEAARRVAEITRAIHAVQPTWIYKKTDSVLRGHVRKEIEAILSVTGQTRALLIPANPSKQRIIRGGVYFVNGTPLAETSFARDPEHPRRSSRVAELLALNSVEKTCVVPDATCAADLASHAQDVDATTLTAGGVDFFQALLRTKLAAAAHDDRFAQAARVESTHQFGAKPHTLFVCGSAAAWDNGCAEECRAHQVPIVVMPEELFAGSGNLSAIRDWHDAVAKALHAHSGVMLAVGRGSHTRSPAVPRELLARLIDATVHALASQTVERIFLEGGATAAALLQRMNWTRLDALATGLIGVAVLRPANGPLLFIKPGSYPWPTEVWPAV
ncbi:MAG: hypothetical protein HY043_12840 [Verrucomicrobia bacterium]|nr:hypothetical protein [Verrucomicrobiota bacterium]